MPWSHYNKNRRRNVPLPIMVAIWCSTWSLLSSCFSPSGAALAWQSRRPLARTPPYDPQSLVIYTAQALMPPSSTRSRPSSTSLYAIGALAKKAKQAELRAYVQAGLEDAVKAQIQRLQENLAQAALTPNTAPVLMTPGPVQQALVKRKGTVTIIAEYKRKLDQASAGFTDPTLYDAAIMSPIFREYGAAAVAVLADERMGGCTRQDLQFMVEEQRRAQNLVPTTLPVISSDLIVDELQIAQCKADGASACLIHLSVVGTEALPGLLQAARALEVEVIVAITSWAELQTAWEAGVGMILFNIDSMEDKIQMLQQAQEQLVVGSSTTTEPRPVCWIANIMARNDRSLQEVEEAWMLRDAGFHAVWVADCLYKGGAQEHAGSIIKSMKSKSSVKWASPQARTGRGEGAREYLGDILM